MYSKLAIGDKAPDFRFLTPWDDEADFYNAVGDKPAVLIFLRYYGCPVCRMEMTRIKQEIDLIRQKQGRVFVALQSSPQTLASLIDREYWPFTVLCDPQGKIFQLYGAESGGIIKYLHPAGLIAAIKAISQGFQHGKFEGKETQLPAAFVLSADKVIRFAHYGENISDMPPLAIMADNI
jgi:thioredoxin-dependent peroxiredoxin